jgi:copper(I)-binding protein
MTIADRRSVSTPVALCVGLMLASAAITAQAVFVVNGPWLRPAAAGGTTDLYMTLTSTEGATLVAVRCDTASEARILAAGRPARTVASLPLPAGHNVELEPNGSKVRLVRLARSLSLGDRVPLVLTIEGVDGVRQEIAVNAEVRRHSAIYDHLHGHAH